MLSHEQVLLEELQKQVFEVHGVLYDGLKKLAEVGNSSCNIHKAEKNQCVPVAA